MKKTLGFDIQGLELEPVEKVLIYIIIYEDGALSVHGGPTR